MTEGVPGSDHIREGSPISMRWWAQVTVLLIIVVELCWVVPWYRTVIQISYVASTERAALVLGGVMLVAYLVARALESLRLVKGLQFGIFAITFLISLIVSIRILLNAQGLSVVGGLVQLDPGAVLVVFTVLWLWWRGLTLARDAIKPTVAWRRFELGMLFFMARVFILVRMPRSAVNPSSELALFVFFLFMGLLSVIFARISYVGIAQGVRKNPFDRRWFVTTTGILILSVGVAAVLSGLLSGQYKMLLAMIAEAVKFLAAAFIFVVSLPWLYVSYLFAPLVPLLRQTLGTPTPSSPGPYPLNPGLLPPGARVPEDQPLSAFVVGLIFWGIILLIVVSLVIRARRGFGWRRWENRNEQESLLKRGEARRLLRKALRDAAGELANRLRPAKRILAAARVRRIYAQLMDLSAELNNPRAAGQTPYEFLPDLGELFTDLTPELELITQSYVEVRYGEYPETQEEIIALESAWKRIESEGHRIKRSGQHKLKTAEVKEVQRTGT